MQGEERMNPPATVNGKMPKIAAFVLLNLAFLSLEVPGAVVQAQPRRLIKSVSKADGTYLYGETAIPNQITKGYVVFQRQQGKVVGALYSPNSHFDCFTGSLINNTLDVKALAFGESKMKNVKINLSNLHQIKPISGNDQRIISVCKQAIKPVF